MLNKVVHSGGGEDSCCISDDDNFAMHSEALVGYCRIDCHYEITTTVNTQTYCIRCGPDEERILDVVPREDRARNSG